MECGFSVLLLLLLLFFPLYSSEEVIKSTTPKAYLRVQKKKPRLDPHSSEAIYMP